MTSGTISTLPMTWAYITAPCPSDIPQQGQGPRPKARLVLLTPSVEVHERAARDTSDGALFFFSDVTANLLARAISGTLVQKEQLVKYVFLVRRESGVTDRAEVRLQVQGTDRHGRRESLLAKGTYILTLWAVRRPKTKSRP